MYKFGIIGYGSRLSIVSEALEKTGKAQIGYIADPRIEEIKEDFIKAGRDISKIEFYDSAEKMLSSCRPDGICVGTRCSMHTKYAKEVIESGFPMFLEKPVCTNREDLKVLEELVQKYPDRAKRVTVSFPLRFTDHIQKVLEIIKSGAIGEPAHIQAWNNVPYAIGYYHKWYRDDNETGGLFLQKATHDFDYITYVCGQKPLYIAAMTSKQVFKGDHEVGLLCRNCPEKDTCLDYTPVHGKDFSKFDQCAFAKDTGNEDSSSAILMFENGVHAVYSQDFIARRSAGRRGARFIGRLGTVEFDWNTNEVVLHRHYEDKKEIFPIIPDPTRGHFGGDWYLANDFINVMGGQDSNCPLSDGIASARLCLCAKESAKDKVFREIK